MARRVHTADDFGVRDWWNSLPPITRTLGAIWSAAAIAARAQLLPLQHLYLDASLILKKGQIWRLVTNAGFLASLSPHFVFRLLWHFIYTPVMERTMTEYEPGEFAFYLMFAVGMIDLVGLFSPFGKIFFSGSSLVFATMYLWSREFPTQDISIFGLIKIKGFYLPWAMLGIEVLFGAGLNELMPDLTGVAVAHLYYFLKTVYPQQTGQQFLKCPLWLTRFMARYYKTRDPAPPQPQQRMQTQQPERDGAAGDATGGFRAFSGAARSLRD